MEMTSDGSSTTQMRSGSRRSSVQMRQRGPSARLKHTSQRPIRSLTSRMAWARANASSSPTRRMWKARRWAVRPPTPGRRESSVINRWTGGAYTTARGLEPGQTEVAEAAGDPAELRVRELLRRAKAFVDGGQHHVLQQLD